MKFAISGSEIGPRGTPEKLVKRAQLAEKKGFDVFTLGDSPLLRELYVSLSLVADGTESIDFGPMVTNPVTRHPVVSACGMCTLHEISGGRAILGLATGDSSIHMLGESRAKLRDMDEATTMFTSLREGEVAEYEGTAIDIDWIDEEFSSLPVFWAAEGPKTQKLAGKLADGVVLGGGVTPDLISEQIDRVHKGAREAGRDPSEIEIWIMARSNVNTDRAVAIDELKSTLAGVARRAYSHNLEEASLPADAKDRLRRLQDEYETSEHNTPGENPNRDLIDELDLTELLVERHAIAGTVEDCIEKVRRINDSTDADGIFLTTPLNRSDTVIERMGDEVIPEFDGS